VHLDAIDQNLHSVCELVEENGLVTVTLKLGVHQPGIAESIRQQLQEALSDLPSNQLKIVEQLEVLPAQSVQAAQTQQVSGVKNIVAVASGKGGVGKSTTAVNIALALAHDGAKVGILDADIYGPSQPQMLGVGGKRPEMHSENMMLPVSAHGLKVISMGNLVTEKTPMVWRGPMVSGALQQLLNNTYWGELDYLIIDMPPGTGDIQLTLSQSVPVSGSVIVTTPQDIALLDARKGIEMFQKVDIPVLGVVENMSTHVCSNCGHVEAIFGERGGDELAREYGVEVLGHLPLTLDIRLQTDSGVPPLITDPQSAVSLEYLGIARQLALGLWRQALAGDAVPEITIADD